MRPRQDRSGSQPHPSIARRSRTAAEAAIACERPWAQFSHPCDGSPLLLCSSARRACVARYTVSPHHHALDELTAFRGVDLGTCATDAITGVRGRKRCISARCRCRNSRAHLTDGRSPSRGGPLRRAMLWDSRVGPHWHSSTRLAMPRPDAEREVRLENRIVLRALLRQLVDRLLVTRARTR